MIYVMLEKEGDEMYVSHGLDSETLEEVVLPQEPWNEFRIECKPTPDGYVLREAND
jgi:hypothetical protein